MESAVLADQAVVIELRLFISSEEETGRLGEGPPDFFPPDSRGAGEPVDIVDLIQENENLSHTGNASQQVEAADVMTFGLLDDGEFQFGQEPVV